MAQLLRHVTAELDLFRARVAAAHRSHATDLRALAQLLGADRAGAPATPGWLGTRLGLDSASVTAVGDRPEQAGHIRRGRDTADRRRVLLVVGNRANDLGWSFFGPLTEQVGTVSASFDERELAAVRRFLPATADAGAAAGTRPS